MSVITRLSNMFSKKDAAQVLGLSLRQQSVSYCYLKRATGQYIFKHNKLAATDAINEKPDTTNLDSNVSEQEPNDSSAKPQIDTASENNTLEQANELLNGQTLAKKVSALQGEKEWEGSCHIILSAAMSQIVQVDRPAVPDAEINGALKWQIKELVTIAPDNLLLDYFESPVDNQAQNKINVVCSPLKEVKDIVTALNVDNLKVASITTEEFAFANLVTAKKDAVLLVCAQPKEEIVLVIVKNGQLFFHRRLRGFTQIADKSPEELDMGNIDSLSLEIQRSTDYFERQLKQASIKEILVLVPMDNEAYLARRLAENTNVPVNLLTLPALYSEHRENACALGATMQADKENA